jgi:uncharacterized tellurite resistance protein B-like protein
MINFSRLLGISTQTTSHGTLESTLAKEFASMEDGRVKYLTGLSGLLGKVAFSDMNIAAEEILSIQNILQTTGKLDQQEAIAVSHLLSEVTNELAGIEDYRYARLINETLLEQSSRREFLNVLFEVAASDGSITAQEDHTIGEIATALKLTRKDYVSVRMLFKEHLSLFQGGQS